MENPILNDPEYLKSIHPKEKIYRKISLIIAMFLWIGTFGILLSYAFFF